MLRNIEPVSLDSYTLVQVELLSEQLYYRGVRYRMPFYVPLARFWL